MTNPYSPKDKPGNDEPEKRENQEKQEEKPAISFSDLMSDKAQGGGSTSSPSPTSFSYMSDKPFFQMRKSEFTHENKGEIKPLIDKFLKTTEPSENDDMTETEKQAILNTREELTKATTAADGVLHALHLARLYQQLRYIEEAKQATLLSLGLSPDDHSSRELFKELERMHPPDLAVSATHASLHELSKTKLRERIKGLSSGRLIVFGDLLIDEYVEGKPERISREAPVLILEHVDTELILGGAANTANNVASLGATCHAIGVCGRDDYAVKLTRMFESTGITHGLVQDPSRPTPVKTRILSKSHSHLQQLLRMDRISHEEISTSIESLLIEKVKQAAGQYQAIVLSDYRGGVMTSAVIKACRQIAQEKNIMLIVDAQDHFERFQDVTLITPNQTDTEKAVGFAINSTESLKEAGKKLMLITGSKALLITRGAEGMVLFEKGKEMVELPAFNLSEVFDVSGAGDTVAATMALAMVTGASFVEAMALGNLAASIVVKKPGTAVTSQKEMLECLELVALPED
jgi:D-glycero-beta-D-manno-heptose-7-phosphate kinase